MEQPQSRLPGERVFALAMLGLALFVLWHAYGIAGFRSLSSAGALPLAAGTVMVVAALAVVVQSFVSKTPRQERGFFRTLLPGRLVGFVVLVGVLALVLDRLGFLLAGTGFLAAAIFWLHRRQPWHVLAWSLLAVLVIYVLFRLVFEVLLPEGIVPERAILAWIGDRLRDLRP
ncbi:MAG: tripartite tricarboxylate transporter TctB family protein [Geminicoccaceae bacterium]|nr:MAG: tripartite tricarboxylate transporter TctB family protein [Geminicoccaceae bacterium]